MRYDGDVLVLSRRNLLALLAKLEEVKKGTPSACMITKLLIGPDGKKAYIQVRAEEDSKHYTSTELPVAGTMRDSTEEMMTRIEKLLSAPLPLDLSKNSWKD